MLGRRGHGLFDKDVLARLERGQRDLEMGGYGRGDGHRVDARIADQVAKITDRARRRIALGRRRQPVGLGIAHHRQLAAVYLADVAREFGAPIAVTDDPEPHH